MTTLAVSCLVFAFLAVMAIAWMHHRAVQHFVTSQNRLIEALVSRNATDLARIDASHLAAERLIDAQREKGTERAHQRAAEDQRYEAIGASYS